MDGASPPAFVAVAPPALEAVVVAAPPVAALSLEASAAVPAAWPPEPPLLVFSC